MSRKSNNLKANTFKTSNGKEQKAKKKTVSKSKKPRKVSIPKERIVRIIGLSLVLFSLYMILAFVSYFFTWWIDFDKVSSIALSDLRGQVPIENWTGLFGAWFSNILIKESFGISSFLILVFLFVLGFKLMSGIVLIPLAKLARHSFLLILWFSVVFGFFFKETSLSILGGVFGYQLNIYMIGLIGKVGSVFLLVFVMISYLAFSFDFKWLIWKSEGRSKKAEGVSNDQGSRNKDEGAGLERTKPEGTGNELSGDKYNTVEFAVTEDESIRKAEGRSKKAEGSGLDPTKAVAASHDPTIETIELEQPNPNDDKPAEVEKPAGNGIEFSVESYQPEAPKTEVDHFTVDTEYDPRLDLPHYKFPPLNLLNDYGDGEITVQKDELEENKNRIVRTLNHYAIKIEKIKATIGPAVTLYEIIPAPGIRISKIKNLEDDIALSLAALGIRIIAPIPGKGTIGIEVPNKNSEIVSIKSILASKQFSSNKYELPLGLGKTIANESFVVDLTKMPHILMAGATGQGKSVGLNAVIASLLYKKHPAQVKFVLIDPKKVELTLYSKIERHFLAKLPDSEEAIITDTRKVVRTLNSLSIEMDNRYDLLKDAQVRNIKEYNAKFIARKLNPQEGHRYLPYIIVVVDEFADLILTAGKEIENPLTRLAQLARAIGIHLIIATQRPSVNIITGTIKANFPARIAYRVISKIDSRTILDGGGADQLIGKGDMLLATGSDMTRLQCAFVDTNEVESITEYIGSQRAYADAFHLPEYADEEDEGIGEFNASERDELFEEAAQLIVQTQQGSTSLLQRKLKLGYNRAGRIIDQLEAAGIVGPFEGSKAREVKIANEMALEQFLKDLNQNNNDN